MPPERNYDDDLEDPEGIDAWEALKRRAPPMSPEEKARLRVFLDRVRKPLAPGDPRRHHFIPEFFQKRFAKDERLFVVPISRERPKIRHVSRIAVEKDLYTHIAIDVGETVSIEKILAQGDGDAAAVIARLGAGRLPLSPEDRASLSIWLALMHVRGPHHRRILEALYDQTFKIDLSLAAEPDAARARLRENLNREPTGQEVAELVEAANDLDSFEIAPHQNALLKLMLDGALTIAPHLLRRICTVVRFPEPGLVLCDRPLLLYQRPENRRPFMGVGIINADELWLPLDRSHALILHSEAEIGERMIDAPPEHGVDDFNQAVVLNTGSEIYCHPEDLDRVVQLRFPDPDKPLMQVTGADWIKGTSDGINSAPVRKRHQRYRRDSK